MKSFMTIIVAALSLLASVNLLAQNTNNSDQKSIDQLEEQPSFKGGSVDKFVLWVFSHLRYPEEAYKNNITGKVFLEFIIHKDGKVRDVKVLRSSGNELLDKEAIRVVSLSPEWKPGKAKGEAINVRYALPVAFDLKGEPKKPAGGITLAASDESANNDTEVVPVSSADEKPKFQGGGNNEFTKWMFNELRYPEEARLKKIMGRTILEFVISKTGRVKDVKVLKSSGSELLDSEALRVISLSPDWEPAKMNGKPVAVTYTFPVIFMLR